MIDSEISLLVLGESGTGKELVARAVHFNGARKAGPFQGINCAALPETLLEAELFGSVKGAFTGADRDKQGLMPAANGGTAVLGRSRRAAAVDPSQIAARATRAGGPPLGCSQARLLVMIKPSGVLACSDCVLAPRHPLAAFVAGMRTVQGVSAIARQKGVHRGDRRIKWSDI